MRAEQEALVGFGRWKLLGADLSGETGSFGDWFERLTDWHEPLLAGPPAAEEAVRQLNRSATDYGGWTAIGAWKVLMEFAGIDRAVRDGAPALAACVRAYDGFGITNLAMHLSMCEAAAFADEIGRPPPMDGFSGPPVFTTTEGPQKSDLFAAAAEQAKGRSPVRLAHVPDVPPRGIENLTLTRLFDFGHLMLGRNPAASSRRAW